MWDKYRNQYSVYRVIPAKVYINKQGICLVTSQEWCDWLWGKTDEIPEVENYDN